MAPPPAYFPEYLPTHNLISDKSKRSPSPYIVTFPLTNGLHPNMTIGISLPLTQSAEALIFQALSAVPDITLARALDTDWDNAAYWIWEGNLHTMSMQDIGAYDRFLDHKGNGPEGSWRGWELFDGKLLPEHYHAFGELWRSIEEPKMRRFKRLPVKKTNQVKQALYEEMEEWDLPRSTLPSPIAERRKGFEDVLPSS